jgi:hypothetical protein
MFKFISFKKNLNITHLINLRYKTFSFEVAKYASDFESRGSGKLKMIKNFRRVREKPKRNISRQKSY